ncbi:MAG: hypothetical protein KF845_04140 [Cyclobacteriaceae bacterium]|nr:hypothetical protein [Cyclobacteriaceae bacterium]
MSQAKSYYFFLILSVLSFSAFSQATRSPFSTFGIGEPYGNALIQNQAQGGTGVSQPQFWFVNNQNPALLVFNYYTVFQAGAILETKTTRSDTARAKGTNGNLNYLVTAFPIKPGKWSTSVGLMPLTNVNYRLQYLEEIVGSPQQDTISVVEQGSGGLSQLYWSNGVRLHDNWAIGLKAAYLFGSISNDFSNTLVSVQQPVYYTAAINEKTYIKDFQFTAGLSFSQDSIGKRDDYRISAGLTYTFNTDMRASKRTVFQRRFLSGTPTTSDTLVEKRGSIKYPSSLTAGLSVSKGSKWAAGVEYTMQNWTEFNSINDEDNQNLQTAWRFSSGGEFTPDHLSDKYFKRITYRTGIHYENAPFLINNNQLRDFGINFGLSMPAGRSSLDFAFSTGKRGNRSKNILEESYFRVYFGITFNDQWFIRRRFD